MTRLPAHPVADAARARELLNQVLDRCVPGFHGHYDVAVLARVLTTTGLPPTERERVVGGATYGMGETWGNLSATASGVTISHNNARPPAAYKIPWTVIDDVAGDNPRALENLEAALDARRAHSRTFPSVYPNLGVRKVANGDIHPEDRALYVERRRTYSVEVVDPWYARHDELGTQLRAAAGAVLEETQGFLDLDLLGAPTFAPSPRPHLAVSGLSL